MYYFTYCFCRQDGSLTPYKGRANATAIINFVKR